MVTSTFNLDTNIYHNRAILIVINNAGERIDVKIKEENCTSVYKNNMDSGWKIHAELPPSDYII